MPPTTVYLLDANVFIQAKRDHYRFAVCPGFWDFLLAQHQAGTIASIDRIKGEIEQGKDDLTAWVKRSMPVSFFWPTVDAATGEQFGRMVAWAQSQKQFHPEAKAEFAAGNDGWLVAYAKVHACVLVTHEVYAPGVRNRVKIPNVCKAFDVVCVNTFDMLETLGARFVLGAHP